MVGYDPDRSLYSDSTQSVAVLSARAVASSEMGLQQTLVNRAQGFVEPGERIEQVVMARTGPSPWWSGIVGIGFLLGITKYRLLVVTDRNVIVLNAGGLNGTVPKGMIRRLRRPTTFGTTSGLWAKVQVANEPLWVHKRFHAGLAVADRAPEPPTSGVG